FFPGLMSDARLLPSTRYGFLAEYQQPHGNSCAFADFAFDDDLTAVQIDAALHDHQAEAGARAVIDVVAPMKGVEKPLSVGIRNANDHELCKPSRPRYARFRTAPPVPRLS